MSTATPFTSAQITDAVAQLLREQEERQRTVLDTRQDDLTDLYLMVRTLIRGQGFAQMEDLRDRHDPSTSLETVKSKLDELDREGLETFLLEYALGERLVITPSYHLHFKQTN